MKSPINIELSLNRPVPRGDKSLLGNKGYCDKALYFLEPSKKTLTINWMFRRAFERVFDIRALRR